MKDVIGYDKIFWIEMVNIGWVVLNIFVVYGGLDFGYMGFG